MKFVCNTKELSDALNTVGKAISNKANIPILEAIKIRAEGDAEAAKYYAEFKKNPELAEFLRSLEALRQILRTRTTLVLDTDTPPFNLLKADAMSKIGVSSAAEAQTKTQDK